MKKKSFQNQKCFTMLCFVVFIIASSFIRCNAETVTEIGDNEDDRFISNGKADTITDLGISTDGIEARAILLLVNTATYDQLDNEVGLTTEAVSSIINYRKGSDNIDGSNDDDLFTSLYELSLPYVGINSFNAMLNYVKNNGYIIECNNESVPGCQFSAGVAEKLFAVQKYLERTVSSLTENIQKIEVEIGKLEKQNNQKYQEINNLINQIETRKDQIESEYERKRRNAIIFAIFGIPDLSVISLIDMMNDDSRLRELQSSLDRARAEKSVIESKIQAYNRKKEELRNQINNLRGTETSLRNAIASIDEVAPEEFNMIDESRLSLIKTRIDSLNSLSNNLSSQISILNEIKRNAQELSNLIDKTIVFLRRVSVRADELLKESQEGIYDLIDILISQDPNAAAERWLQREYTNMVNRLIANLNLDLDPYLSHILKRYIEQGGVNPQDFEDALLDAYKKGIFREDNLEDNGNNGENEEQNSLKDLNITIPDNDPNGIVSVMTLNGEGIVENLRVIISITHSYPGDLVITLNHNSTCATLHEHTGGSDDSVIEYAIFDISSFEDESISGDWILHIVDDYSFDEGILNQWQLNFD